MLETCPVCKQAVLFTSDKCPSCGGTSLASERVPVAREEPPSFAPAATRREDLQSTAQPQQQKELFGIRGWLLLPAIGLILGSVFTVFNLIASIGLVAGVTGFGIGVAYSVPALLVRIGLSIWIWVAAIRFFRRSSAAPRTMIQLILSSTAASVALFVLGMLVGGWHEDIFWFMLRNNNFIGMGVSAAIWIPYLKKSKRVKATFTN